MYISRNLKGYKSLIFNHNPYIFAVVNWADGVKEIHVQSVKTVKCDTFMIFIIFVLYGPMCNFLSVSHDSRVFSHLLMLLNCSGKF